MLNRLLVPSVVAAGIVFGCAGAGFGQECDKTFDSTYALIQEAIFENKGCTDMACHGSSAAGGLDLQAEVSWQNLVEQPATSVPEGTIPGLKRVVPGQKDQSLLFLNLAAATLPDQWDAPVRPMPLGLGALTTDELEAVREWIEQGAPRQGTVPGTGELLDACLPPAEPLPIVPLPAPDPAVGRQIRMPKWNLPANSEDEVCFASYFDISEGIPERFLSADGERFRFDRSQIRQDPLSHHLIVTYYTGTAPYDDPSWGAFKCRGGAKEGQSCEPTDLDFCGEGLCGSEPKRSIACINFGPPDSQTSQIGFPGTQEASFEQSYPPGVYGELPTKGMLIWNSHAFNLTDEDGKLEAWTNFDFAEPEDQMYRVRGIFNTSMIFAMTTPPFAAEEICNHHVFPPDSRLFELNSHNHQRGKRFRIFEGRYACDGGDNSGAACSPRAETSFEIPDVCEGAPCVRLIPPTMGDCDGDARVGINDLTRCVNISLGNAGIDTCRPGDANGDRNVSIAELVSAVKLSLAGPEVDSSEPQLLYTNQVYNDPTVVRFDPPREYPDGSASASARTLTFCSLYDNGYSDPNEVKRKSTSPPTPFGAVAPGGPCRTATACTEGKVGAPCSGDDSACDTAPGVGDGVCDACVLRGGVTTEDEMFIMMGAFFVED